MLDHRIQIALASSLVYQRPRQRGGEMKRIEISEHSMREVESKPTCASWYF